MKTKFTLLLLLLFLAFRPFAQNVTGIWSGYFVQNSFGYYDERYKFEVQVAQADNSGINGITYSYKTTVFYGKASLSGFYTKATKVLTITETKLLEVKVQGESQACLMTCYLEYSKVGDLETLTGTYTSRNLKDKGDCGSGKIYLEKTKASDFYKEDFLIEKEREINRNSISKSKVPIDKQVAQSKPVVKKPALVKKPSAQSTAKNNPTKPLILNKSKPTAKPALKPGAESDVVKSPGKRDIEAPQTAVMPPNDEPVKLPRPSVKTLPKPEAMRTRNNELVKTFYTSASEIKIDLYDNGEIDGDTITVYDNNRLIVSKKRLTDKPITFTIKVNENEPQHEFVMIAENLGSIPPNTALMIITAGSKRYELFVTSTEKKNAVVVVEYRPGQESK